jgi:DNA-3-methyladenine glycosylase
MRLKEDFYLRDVLDVAPDLVGKRLVRNWEGSGVFSSLITEVEAYRGEEDLACHASRGRTRRTDIMYHRGGKIYVYLIYGMYWMMNIVTGRTDQPQALLIRGLADISGPGRITKRLEIDRSFYGEDLCDSSRLWLEPGEDEVSVKTGSRIGIEYAGEYWKSRPWRFNWTPGEML